MTSQFRAIGCAIGISLGFVPQLFAQVIQLPTFHTFSVGTTVLVPDRGRMMLGGVDRASFGANAFGLPGVAGIPGAGRLFGNRAIGGQVQSSRVSAAATIIDLQELDRSVLGQGAAAGAPPTNPAIARKAAFLAQHISRNATSGAAPTSIAPGARTSAQPPAKDLPDAETQARDAYQLAERAESVGQLATARIQYKRAAMLSRGKLRAEALARLAAITTPKKDAHSQAR